MVFTEQKGGPPVKTILEWWKERGHAFALISEVAKLIIAVPATSAPSERVFSTAGRVCGRYRASMSPQVVQAIVREHENCRKRKSVPVAPAVNVQSLDADSDDES